MNIDNPLFQNEVPTASDTQYRDMVESIQDGLIHINHNWIITYINQRAAHMAGCEPQGFTGRNFWEAFPEFKGTLLEEKCRHVMVERTCVHFEMQGAVQDQVDCVSVFPSRAGILVYRAACPLATVTDMAERKRAEEELRKNTEALRESEEKFHGAFNHAAIGFAMTTSDGRFVDANPAFCAITGFQIEELKTFAFDQLIHPEDFADNIALNHQMSNGQIDDFVIENRYVRKDGQVVWVRKSVSQVRSAQGAPKWNIALVEDVTERRRAEAAVRTTTEALNERNRALEQAQNDLINERSRLMAVMEALPIGLAIYDLNGGVIQANQGFEAVWGSPRPPANSVDDYELYKAWWVESGLRVQPEEWAAARAVQRGETITGQYIQIQKFDGSTGFILNSGAPVRDAQGQIIGGAVAIMEITDRVNTEKALKESKDRFRVALASVPLLVYTCDRDQRYTWVYNPQLGFRAEDTLGKRDDEVLPPEAAAELIAAKQQALDSGQGDVQVVKVPLNGQNYYYILTTEPMKDARGMVTGLTCSAIDITTQKQLEIEQEEYRMQMEVQRRLMEYREKERQEIARDLHDGPLQLLSGTIFYLQAARETIQDPVLKLELEQASMNLKAAIREVRDTMNALRPPAIIRFGFAKSARMHAEDFREKHPEIKITLKMIDDSDLLSEPVRLALFRIYQESLNNIVKHANASRIRVRTMRKANQFYLEIRDNGRGFSIPTDLVGQTHKGHYGLVGMKERAEAIGGTLTVTSEPGKGARVLVVVPERD